MHCEVKLQLKLNSEISLDYSLTQCARDEEELIYWRTNTPVIDSVTVGGDMSCLPGWPLDLPTDSNIPNKLQSS